MADMGVSDRYQVCKNLGDADDRAAGNDPIALPPPQEATVMKGSYLSVASAADVKLLDARPNTLGGKAFRRVCAARFLLGGCKS